MDVQYPLYLDMEVWKEFLKMRKAIKKPLTPYGEKLALRRLDGLKDAGEDPTAVIEQSIMMCYQGLFPVATGKQERVDWDAVMRGEG